MGDCFIVYDAMIQSMTGFGSASNDDFTVEIRSVNHRFIDIGIKMPAYMTQHEIPLRNILKKRFDRGRFEVSISLNSAKTGHLKLNAHLAKSIYSALQNLQKELSIPGEVTIETLSGYREILAEEEPSYDINALLGVFQKAVGSLEEMRQREGAFLLEDISRRIGILKDFTHRIKLLSPEEVARWREKFTERLRLIVDAGTLDNSRILQEAAIMADKLDISEEISRIESHLQQFLAILANGAVMGKKLDFLLQELNRETNTLSYKTGDYAIASLVVEMKTEIEKIREQVQNIQ